jgi:antitoxin component of MazEF toxin-antitoxin module
MHVLVEQVGSGSRLILDRGLLSRIGVAESDTQVVNLTVEGDAIVIRSVPAEHRAAALAAAEAARDERERLWRERIGRPRG